MAYLVLSSLIAAAKGDALFRPSNASRWIGCPGSVQASLMAPRTEAPSNFALEGSAAHKVAEHALRGERQPHEWMDRMVRLNDRDGWFVDEEMAELMTDYVAFVKEESVGAEKVFYEKTLSLSPLDWGDPLLAENRGTGDVVVLDPARRRIKIIDLKYGRGVMVSASSPQPKDYGLLALVGNPIPGGWDEVEVVIAQPRAPHEAERLKRAVYPADGLLNDFLGTLLQAMTRAIEPDPPLIVGDWCRWCPAAAHCPALRDQALNVARDAFADVPLFTPSTALPALPTIEEAKGRFPNVADLDPSEIATILDLRGLYDAFIEAVEQRAVNVSMASPGAIPGWGLKARDTHRKWKDEAVVVPAVLALGVQGLIEKDFYNVKLKSPAQVEKMLPKAKRGEIAGLAEKPQGGLVLVRAEEAQGQVSSAFTALTKT